MDCAELHETKIHGSIAFPYSVYRGRIPEWIHSFPLHWHEGFELIYCEAGSIQAVLWGRAYTLRAGDLLVVLPHAVHSIERAGPAEGEYYNIIFHPSLFKGAGGDPCYDKYVLPFVNGERTMDCFQPAGSAFNLDVAPCVLPLIAHRRESHSTYELMVKSNLFQLLYHMTQYSVPAAASDGGLRLSYSRL